MFLALTATSPAAETFAAEPDWISVGLVLAILGSFLLGNAILFRPPRVLIEELFGVRNLRLPAIREYVFHRVQVGVGFTWLLAGFASMLFGRLRSGDAQPVLPVFWVGCIVVLTAVLLAFGWWWSSRSFRGHVRDHLLEHPPDFEGNLALAREIGALFGVESSDDDSVQAYLERLRTTIGLPPPARGPRRGPGAPRPDEVEESVL